MANTKRKISHTDYMHCYQYFKRAIQTGRIFTNTEHSLISDKAKHEFSLLICQDNDNSCLQALQNWIDQFIDQKTWGRCYRAANQKRYLDEHQNRTINISDNAHGKLKTYAQSYNLSLSQAIINLIDNDIVSNSKEPYQLTLDACADYRGITSDALLEKLINSERRSIEYDKERAEELLKKTDKESKLYKINDRKISKLFKTHLDHLSRIYDPRDIYSDVTDFLEVIVKDSIISGEVDKDKIVHSESIKVMRSNYFDYASTIASFVASITGTLDVFLTRQLFKTEHNMVFVGMPINLEVAVRLYKIMVRQAGAEKSDFLKTLSKRMKAKNRSSRASDHMDNWASPFDCLCRDDELYTDNSYNLLCQYKDHTWPSRL